MTNNIFFKDVVVAFSAMAERLESLLDKPPMPPGVEHHAAYLGMRMALMQAALWCQIEWAEALEKEKVVHQLDRQAFIEAAAGCWDDYYADESQEETKH